MSNRAQFNNIFPIGKTRPPPGPSPPSPETAQVPGRMAQVPGRHPIWAVLRMRPARTRGRTPLRLLGGQNLLEQGHLHGGSAPDDLAYQRDYNNKIPDFRPLRGQPRQRPCHGEMRLHPHRRDRHRRLPVSGRRPPHPRTQTEIIARTMSNAIQPAFSLID